MFEEFVKSFIMLLVIMEPFGGIPIFIKLTKGFSVEEIKKSANHAAVVAGMIIFAFVFLGDLMLHFFSVSMDSFRIAGGLLLFVLGISYVLDLKIKSGKKYTKDITVPMASPLIAGPGVITALIILVSMYGFVIPLIAALLNLAFFWVLMYYSDHLHKVIGEQGAEILSRIMGLVLAAIAVEFVVAGIKAIWG